MKRILIAILVLIMFVPNSIYSQERDELVLQLSQQLNDLDKEGNYKKIISVFNELNRLDPGNSSRKRTFKVVLKKYHNEIFSDEELLDTLVNNFDDVFILPLDEFITFFYKSNDVKRLNKLLYKVSLLDTNYLTIDNSFLEGLDPQINKDQYNLIVSIIEPYSISVKQPTVKSKNINLPAAETKIINKLFQVTNKLLREGRFYGAITNLMKILDIDPENIEAKKLLGNTLLIHKRPILQYKELFVKTVPYLDDFTLIPVDTLLFYYYSVKQFDLVEILLSQISLYGGNSLSLSADYFLQFDKETNPRLYNKIFQELLPFYKPTNPAKDLLFCYNLNLEEPMLDLLEDDSIILKEGQITLDNLLSLDPELNEKNFKLLFPRLIELVRQGELDSLSDLENIYTLAKMSFMCELSEKTNYFFDKIIQSITTDIHTYKTQLMWSVASIYKDQTYRAKIFLDQIYAYGSEEDLNYLKSELLWWRGRNLDPEFINPTLKNYFNIPVPITYQKFEDNNDNYTDNDNNLEEITFGNYYALIIGIQEYKDENITDLRYPVTDASAFAEVLTNNYLFNNENVSLLLNPTRDEIISTFYNLKKVIKENDNLLVFYAGHGVWDEQIEQGYWLPKDAQYDNISNWLSNTEIRDLIKGINSKHSLLIADACFSGSIFKTREAFIKPSKSITETYKLTSRQAITSGSLRSVPDKSVFIEFLLKYLSNNNEKYLPAQKLYLEFKDAVTNNSLNNQTPRFGVIHNSGDEGGDFIFIHK